jgi:hypothetical protein
MASEILGLFTSAQQYQQNQLSQFQNRAFQEVQLNPFQQAALGARTAGYQLGQGIGGALGGQDPQLQLIARRQALASQLDPNNPQSYMQVAKMAADAGDQQFAMAIADAGRKAMGDFALIQQRNRERQGADPFEQLIRSGKYTPASLAAYKVSQNVGDLVLLEKEGAANKPFEFEAKEARLQELKSGLRVLESQPNPNKEAVQRLKDSIQAIEGVPKPESRPSVGSEREAYAPEMFNNKTYAELTPAQKKLVNDRVDEERNRQARSGATPAAAQVKAISKNKTDLAAQVETDAYGATDRLTLARNLKSLLPTAFTGVDSNLKLQASRVAEVFGINIQGVPDSQIIDTILGEMTIGSAASLKGGLSDKDVKFLKETIGTRGLSVKTLEFVANKIEEDALIDSQINEVVNNYVSSGGDLNKFNFASERKNVTDKIRKDKKRLEELRNKAKTQ